MASEFRVVSHNKSSIEGVVEVSHDPAELVNDVDWTPVFAISNTLSDGIEPTSGPKLIDKLHEVFRLRSVSSDNSEFLPGFLIEDMIIGVVHDWVLLGVALHVEILSECSSSTRD